MYKINLYKLIERSVDDGIEAGWRRAHKHTNEPEPSYVREQIETAIMNAVSEWLEYSGE
jgi:hypothetical protein